MIAEILRELFIIDMRPRPCYFFFIHDKIPSYNVSLTRKRAHFTSRLKVFCEDLKINKCWQAFRKSIDPVAFSPRRKFIEQDAYRQEAIYLRSIVKWYQLETIVIIVYYRNYYFSKLHRSRFLRKEGEVESAATSEIDSLDADCAKKRRSFDLPYDKQI